MLPILNERLTLSAQELSQLTGIGVDTICAMTRKGILTKVRATGQKTGKIWITTQSIRDWLGGKASQAEGDSGEKVSEGDVLYTRMYGGEPVLTVEETAQALAIGTETVRRRIRDGTISAVRIGKRWFILEKELERIIEGRSA